ncbi:hypothetical protein L596_016921 [Steinernema carpocapsae]|uniref:Protein regulator of cytokinesis 1 n=1 Tax=Steinernema carpocapsae TaxID=34508 RepID=A0A4U5NLA0_STECR|nr:hypothetical protein L596_016921 [Steinernema carpocapsae]
MASSRKRRLSLDMETAEAVENINSTMQRLHEIWEQISMDESARVKRVRNAYSHLKQLLAEMVEGEEEMAEQIVRDIKKNTEKVANIRTEMEMRPFPFDDYEENSIALWKALEKDLKDLKKTTDERVQEEKEIREQMQEMVRKLDDDELLDEVPFTPSQKVPTTSELATLRLKLEDLQTMYASRVAELLHLQSFLIKETRHMNYQALSKEIRDFIDDDLIEVDVLSAKRIEEIKKLSSNVKEEFVRWAEDAQFRYLELYSQIKELWDKCYVSEMERCFPEVFDPEIQTNEDIEFLKDEVKRLDKCLSERKPIYANIEKWQALWTEKCEYEDKASHDRNFYNNRGGQLQTILKRQAEVDRALPRLQREIEMATNIYRSSHPGEDVLIDGVSPTEYIEMAMEKHRQEKDRRKMERMSPSFRSPMKSMSSSRLQRMTPNSSPLAAQRARNMSESSLRKIATPISSPMASPIRTPKTRNPFSPITNRSIRKSSKSPKTSSPLRSKGIHGVRRQIQFK